jgi:hypothetical protein
MNHKHFLGSEDLIAVLMKSSVFLGYDSVYSGERQPIFRAHAVCSVCCLPLPGFGLLLDMKMKSICFSEISVEFRRPHGVISQKIELFLSLFIIAHVLRLGVIQAYFPENVVFEHFYQFRFSRDQKITFYIHTKQQAMMLLFTFLNECVNGVVYSTIIL